jgi:hypothetical protein
MSQHNPTAAGDRIIETMIELAQCSRRHRIIVAGANGPQNMFHLHRRGYNRVATTATCGLPLGQYGVALVEWRLLSIKALEATLDWLVHFLAPTGVLTIWVDSRQCPDRHKLASMLDRLGFRIEAGTRCEHGFAVSACRPDASQQAIAA